MLKNNLLNFKITGNRCTTILLVSLLIVGFSFQCNFCIQSFLFGEIENESKELESERFRAREQAEFTDLKDSAIGYLFLSSSNLCRKVNFSTASSYFYSSILSHELFNHSPPVSV